MKKQLHHRMDWQTAFMLVGQVATKQAAVEVGMKSLGISRAHLYRLIRRWFSWQGKEVREEWINAVREKRESQLPEKVQDFLKKEITYLTEKSIHFRGYLNFSLLTQQCHQEFKKRFSRHTIRRWAIQEKLFKPEIHSTAKALTRFDVGAVGELFQHDSSPHLWVPNTNRTDVLILSIDDHSRKIVGAKLVPHDTSWHHLCVVRETVERYGRPIAYYTDNHMIFLPGIDLNAQFTRALTALEIDPRLTGKSHPEAKGKVEKRFDYLQRRIPYLCERYRIKNLTAANKILDEQVDYFNDCHVHAETQQTPNQRWKKAMAEGRCHLRELPVTSKLDLIFGIHYTRKIKKDGRFVFNGETFHLPSAPRYGEITLILHPPFGRRTYTRLTAQSKEKITLGQFIKPAGHITWKKL